MITPLLDSPLDLLPLTPLDELLLSIPNTSPLVYAGSKTSLSGSNYVCSYSAGNGGVIGIGGMTTSGRWIWKVSFACVRLSNATHCYFSPFYERDLAFSPFSPSRHCASPNQRTTLPIPSLITLPPSRCPLIIVPLLQSPLTTHDSPLAIENHRSSSSFCSDHRCELSIGKTLRSASSSLRSSPSRSGVLKNRAIIMACVCNSATLRICFSLRFAYSD
ncbi:uncharacterized protein [Arachis hypogaea]|uniref:uncharacterized protein n=1 Tax=Arachis hypogaea TaxID=3818 RepID=UPI000DED377D|nr:uncharacterized protein LOC112803332 [Arachis hypogaea]